MARDLVRIEDERTIQTRRILRHAFLHCRIPEFDCSAPFVLPAIVQLEDEIDAPLPVLVIVVVRKICVDVEISTWTRLVQTAALEAGIRHKPRDTGKLR